MSLLDDVSIVVTPNGYKAGELYAVIPVPTEGADVIINGDFATDSDWSKGTGWTISGGSANCDGSQTGTSNLNNSVSNGLVNNVRYVVKYTISNYSAGAIRIKLGNTGYGDYSSANGTYTATLTALVSTFPYAQFNANSSFAGSIDNVSVKEYTAADMDVTRETAATRVDENGLVNYAEVIGGEEVTNGDFELNSDWNNFSTPTTSEQSTEQSHTGTYSWKVIADATQEGIFSPNNFSITNGNSYSVSLWIYSVSGNSIKSGLNNTNVSVFTERTVIAGQWTNINYEATATSTGASYISILSQNSLQFFVDNVSVKEVTRDNVPRIDYTGGGCPHILAEPQRTNLILYSEDISDGTWNKDYITVTSDSTNSLDGTQNADLLLETINNTRHIFWDNASVSGGDYTVSIFLKKQNNRYVFFQSGVDNASKRYGIIYDFDGEVVTDINSLGSPTNTSYKIEQHINGWVRLSITQTHTSGGVYLVGGGSDAAIPTYNSAAEPVYAGDSANGFYAWGGQIEQGSYPTSYIPTSGSTVTRNQDIFTRDGIGSLINSTEGVLFVEMAALSDDGTNRIIGISDGTNGNRAQIYYSTSSNSFIGLVYSGGVLSCELNTTLSNATDFIKVALSYKLNDFKLYINGVEVATDTSGNSPIGLDRLDFSLGVGILPFYGKVKQLQVYKTALTDEQLLQLTGESGTDFYESYAEMASALTYTIQ